MASGKSRNGGKSWKKSTVLDDLCEAVHECNCIYGIAREVDRCFEPLSREEVSGLKVGDSVWLDMRYYFQEGSPQATVKTYQSITLVSVKKPKGWKNCKYFTYETRRGGVGYVSVGYGCRGLDCDLWKLTDQKSLEALVREYGGKITSIGEHIWH